MPFVVMLASAGLSSTGIEERAGAVAANNGKTHKAPAARTTTTCHAVRRTSPIGPTFRGFMRGEPTASRGVGETIFSATSDLHRTLAERSNVEATFDQRAKNRSLQR